MNTDGEPPAAQSVAVSTVGQVLAGLASFGVEFVVIGGVAAASLGSGMTTYGVDITPNRDQRNLKRLARFLKSVDARLAVEDAPGGMEIPLDARLLAQFTNAAFDTTLGRIDCVFSPDGIPGGYRQLMKRAVTLEAFGIQFHAAHIDDIIASKRAANRPKDQAAIPNLEALAERRAERGLDQ